MDLEATVTIPRDVVFDIMSYYKFDGNEGKIKHS